jgi:hypothetical protein
MSRRSSTRRSGRGAIVWGLLLVVVGLIWFLNNIGYLPGDLWRVLWRFWPVLVILAGVEVALRGFPNRVAVPLLVLAVAAIVVGLLVLAPTLPQEGLLSDSFTQERGSIEGARIELEMDKADVSISALETTSDLLAAGQFDHSTSIVIERKYEEASGSATLKLSDRYDAFFPFFFLEQPRNDWVLQLSPEVALDLQVTGDDSHLDLGLQGLIVNTLTAELDDCSGQVGLADTDGQEATLTLSGGELTVIVPQTVGVRVKVELSDSSLTIDSSRFTEVGPGEYLSQGYEGASSTTDLTIKASDSKITVR